MFAKWKISDMPAKMWNTVVLTLVSLLLVLIVWATIAMVRDLAYMRGFLAGETSCMEVDRD